MYTWVLSYLSVKGIKEQVVHRNFDDAIEEILVAIEDLDRNVVRFYFPRENQNLSVEHVIVFANNQAIIDLQCQHVTGEMKAGYVPRKPTPLLEYLKGTNHVV